ncbi:hypothetical protein ASE00_01805 [Sphingomonas sp. Root710]|nr:hypothetical protein ASE00_01805 [Sphingomonas sp. Root710]
MGLCGFGDADQHGGDACEIDYVALDDGNDEPGGDTGVDRVAAIVEDAERRLRGEGMAGGDRLARAALQRAAQLLERALRIPLRQALAGVFDLEASRN